HPHHLTFPHLTASELDGTSLMPYLKRVNAAGKTSEELGKEIADGLRGRYLKDPNVLVAIREFNSRSFLILGAVKKPGLYLIEGRSEEHTSALQSPDHL